MVFRSRFGRFKFQININIVWSFFSHLNGLGWIKLGRNSSVFIRDLIRSGTDELQITY